MDELRIPFRKKLQIAALSSTVVGKFRFIWRSTRKYTVFTIHTYSRIVNIVDKLKIKIPKPLVKMEQENGTNN